MIKYHVNILKKNVPKEGQIRLLLVTEKQYSKIEIIVGGVSNQEKTVNAEYIKKVGIKAEFECETELSPEEAAGHCKGVFKGTPEGKVLYFSIQPDGFFG